MFKLEDNEAIRDIIVLSLGLLCVTCCVITLMTLVYHYNTHTLELKDKVLNIYAMELEKGIEQSKSQLPEIVRKLQIER